jgi:hypothetical protein
MRDDAIVALIRVMPMRQPVAGAQVQLDIAEQPHAILGFERGVAEVGSRATVTPPLVDQAIRRARERSQGYATPCARGPARRQFRLARGKGMWRIPRYGTPSMIYPLLGKGYAGQME